MKKTLAALLLISAAAAHAYPGATLKELVDAGVATTTEPIPEAKAAEVKKTVATVKAEKETTAK